MADKSASLYIRMKPETKEKAEEILNQLGVSPSMAVNMFYEQVIMQRGLPFEVKLPPKELFPDENTKEEFYEFLHKRYESAPDSTSVPLEQFVADHKNKYHVELPKNGGK